MRKAVRWVGVRREIKRGREKCITIMLYYAILASQHLQ